MDYKALATLTDWAFVSILVIGLGYMFALIVGHSNKPK